MNLLPIKKFSCDKCGKLFHQQCTLTIHLRSHDTGKKYVCHVCRKSFTFKSVMLKHAMSHMMENIGIIYKGKNSFQNRQNAMSESRKNKFFKCTTCSKKFRNQESLEEHIESHREKRQLNLFTQKSDNAALHEVPIHQQSGFSSDNSSHDIDVDKTFNNKIINSTDFTKNEDGCSNDSSQDLWIEKESYVISDNSFDSHSDEKEATTFHMQDSDEYSSSTSVSSISDEPSLKNLDFNCVLCGKSFTAVPSFIHHVNTHQPSYLDKNSTIEQEANDRISQERPTSPENQGFNKIKPVSEDSSHIQGTRKNISDRDAVQTKQTSRKLVKLNTEYVILGTNRKYKKPNDVGSKKNKMCDRNKQPSLLNNIDTVEKQFNPARSDELAEGMNQIAENQFEADKLDELAVRDDGMSKPLVNHFQSAKSDELAVRDNGMNKPLVNHFKFAKSDELDVRDDGMSKTLVNHFKSAMSDELAVRDDGTKAKEKVKTIFICRCCNKKFASRHFVKEHLNMYFEMAINRVDIEHKPFINQLKEDNEFDRVIDKFIYSISTGKLKSITHGLKKSGEKQIIYHCAKCQKSFVKQHHIIAHIKNCKPKPKKSENFKCQDCNGIFKTDMVLKKHILLCHNHLQESRKLKTEKKSVEDPITEKPKEPEENKVEIRIWNETQKQEKKLIENMTRSGKVKKLKEVTTGKETPKPEKISEENKIRNKTVNQENKSGKTNINKPRIEMTCQRCGKICDSLKEYIDHIDTSHNSKPNEINSDAEFICAHCNTSFDSQSKLYSHLKGHKESKKQQSNLEKYKDKMMYNNETGQWGCTICKKSLSNKTNLLRHISLHDENLNESHVCPFCNRMFKYHRYLMHHITYMHNGQEKEECLICHAKFTKKTSLQRHMDLHTGESVQKKILKCEVCGKRFKGGKELMVHTRIHTGERPFPCDKCHYKAINLWNLKRHLVTHEKGRKRKRSKKDIIDVNEEENNSERKIKMRILHGRSYLMEAENTISD
ncbi:zinc finger protein 567-like [Mytilus californianus]|uniref:zinc finger protein 567-like n=1 Tax=Mytilus californianus TaxID=6549 RepID=UPI00224731EB|nr:zinc finger protein 567-like [Mytilus californianus]